MAGHGSPDMSGIDMEYRPRNTHAFKSNMRAPRPTFSTHKKASAKKPAAKTTAANRHVSGQCRICLDRKAAGACSNGCCGVCCPRQAEACSRHSTTRNRSHKRSCPAPNEDSPGLYSCKGSGLFVPLCCMHLQGKCTFGVVCRHIHGLDDGTPCDKGTDCYFGHGQRSTHGGEQFKHKRHRSAQIFADHQQEHAKLSAGTVGACRDCRSEMVMCNGEFGQYYWCRNCGHRRSISAHLKDAAEQQGIREVAERGDLRLLCLPTLKHHCAELGLKVSGLKLELIARLMSQLCPGTDSAIAAEAVAEAVSAPGAKNQRRAESTLRKFRLVAEIRGELARRGLDTQGLKAVLAERLRAAVYAENNLLGRPQDESQSDNEAAPESLHQFVVPVAVPKQEPQLQHYGYRPPTLVEQALPHVKSEQVFQKRVPISLRARSTLRRRGMLNPGQTTLDAWRK
eukprot:TRINITY_DN5527_c0_g1_i1.p1 TRINITY_DN5527_c0_g1~~TRINITY_DN5527_c0_g1_i1.p1  ORF type:complete len:453 (+),score=78.04 TRINITY_DN5527_c0_g1_i1:1501-2859(+)